MIAVTDDQVADASGEALRKAFHAGYAQVYGYTDEHADLEILNLRTTAIGVTRKPDLARRVGERPAATTSRERRIFLDGAPRTARVLDRASLEPGVRLAGPVIVEQYDTTVLVPPGYTVTADHSGNLIGEAIDGNR